MRYFVKCLAMLHEIIFVKCPFSAPVPFKIKIVPKSDFLGKTLGIIHWSPQNLTPSQKHLAWWGQKEQMLKTASCWYNTCSVPWVYRLWHHTHVQKERKLYHSDERGESCRNPFTYYICILPLLWLILTTTITTIKHLERVGSV